MKTVLVTGATGFIGKNLCAMLEQDKDIKILKYDKKNTYQELKKYLSEAEFIFHLAGVNRPKNKKEFDKGNRGFTEKLLEIIDREKKKTPIAITSSIQADLNNSYGKSKKASEKALFKWSKRTGVPVYVYRLPNVFGKWCRPNYNSVVATFCNNIANDLPIKINNPKTELTLVYIDDVVNELMMAMNCDANIAKDGYCYVTKEFKVTLKSIVDTIYSFKDSRKTLKIPNLDEEFKKDLYATFISYLNKKNFGYNLEMKRDDRGWLSEFIKSDQFGQIFISRTKPGITRGNHWHHTKIEKFLVIKGEAEVRFRKIGEKEILKYKVSGKNLKVLDIPAGYTHSITNVGKNDLMTMFWADEIFNHKKADTYFLEV